VSADLVAHLDQPARGDDHGQADGAQRAHPLAESIWPGDSEGRGRNDGRRLVASSRRARATPFSPQVNFLKDEVFDICGALALGESLCNRLGLSNEAAYLSTVFGVVEGRLIEPSSAATTG
jgi:hypothetical protein